jgi:hypothetical protein
MFGSVNPLIFQNLISLAVKESVFNNDLPLCDDLGLRGRIQTKIQNLQTFTKPENEIQRSQKQEMTKDETRNKKWCNVGYIMCKMYVYLRSKCRQERE